MPYNDLLYSIPLLSQPLLRNHAASLNPSPRTAESIPTASRQKRDDAKTQGLMSEGGFKAVVWQGIARSYSDPKKNKPRICETKWSRIKKWYLEVKFLRELSRFGWDEVNCVLTAESEVWAEIAKKYPEKLKWPGSYSFYGALADVDLDVFKELDGDDIDFLIDPLLHTPNLSDNEDEVKTKTRAVKRHRLSIQAPRPKKAKTSGLGVMDKVVDGIASMAEAITKGSLEITVKESTDSTLEGQA
ncbi:hypothetical protein L207DRAFT_528330 [Hyaloscypha variabilis F]|uniref:Myb/SANT-like domain-containing protein n=1 Tax=Hyaloscypha variabilis (strain UAMH 11265 / GT02V1 / F) TaxID=1149755 RepID=A0A2J6RT78_HYAVF|nr:hypothetical protein L207DRAFT_528330 [Hyaloscypha variabilis F]